MPTSQDIDGLSLGKLWLILRRRSFWFIITFGVVFASVGVVSLGQWILRPQYRGSFQLLVSDPLAEKGSGGGLASLARVDDSVNVPNLVEVLRSPMLLNPLARQLGLPPGSLQGRVSIGLAAKDSDLLTVILLWDNPKQGSKIIESLAKDYLDYSLRRRKEKLNQGIQFLDEQAPGLQQRVVDLQQELASFRRTHVILSPEAQAGQLEASRAGLVAELRSLKQSESQLQGLLAMVQSGKLVSPFQSPSSANIATSGPSTNIKNNFAPLLAELVQVEGELAKVEASYRSDSPLAQSLRARRDRLRPLLQQREKDSIFSALQINNVQQAKIQEQFSNLGAEFRRNPELIKTFEALQQRLAVATTNLGSYLSARESFRLESAQSTVPWQVISPPQFGVVPFEPDLQKRLSQGLLLGLAAGLGAALLRDRLDRVFHSNREVEELLKLPILTSVPFMTLSTDSAVSESIKEMDKMELFTLRESLRSFYQSLRTLRASRTLRVVAVTSAAASEGKTTTVAILGQTLVDMGMKVLLVDADLRRPRLHQRLGLDNTRGISELFSENPPPLEDLYHWVNPNLALLAVGNKLPDPARLLSSERCGEIIQQIRDQQEFNLIVFDTPPALELVDPLLISEHMDGLILLVSLGKIPRELPVQVIRKIKESGVDLLGVVTNQRTFTASGYGYGYGYGYGERYAFGYGDEEQDNQDT